MNNYTPIEYIKIDIANQYGLDKKSFKQRIAWVNSIKDLAKYTAKADKPAQFEAARLALEDAKNGTASGHLVGLDACSSGIAILGLLTGCHTTSKNTGIIGEERMDMYHQCTLKVNELMNDTDINIPRADIKNAQMTFFYGSKAMPKRVFGEDTLELKAFYDAQYIVAPGACMFMEDLLESWQPYALKHTFTLPDNFHAEIPVMQKMKAKIEIDELESATLTYIYEDNIGAERGLSIAANITHGIDGFIVRETVRRCSYNEELLLYVDKLICDNHNNKQDGSDIPLAEQQRDNHGFISIAVVHDMNKDNILQFSQCYREEIGLLITDILHYEKSFPVITIHDEFKCHANYMNTLRRHYVGILAEIAESDIGQRILQEVRLDDSLRLTKISNDLGDAIRQGEYSLS